MRDILPSRDYRGAWLVLAIFCAFGVFDHSLWSSNDTREGAMIREMVREGVWVTPVFNGRPYLEKPPLLHWTAVALCKLFGRVNEGLVRLPAALYGFGALLIIGRWARALGRERAGLVAAFLCATSALYFEYSRIVLTDAALTFMVVLSLYLFWRAYTAGSTNQKRWIPFLAAAALAFYAKGLIGPGLIWVAVGAFLAYRREWKLIVALGAVFSVLFVLILAPWVAALWRSGGPGFLHSVFWENQFGRFLAFNDPNLPLDPYYVHKEPVLFYLISLPVRLLPWTLLVIPALIYFFRKKSPVEGLAATFIRCALLGMLALLHVSSAKAACYTLPIFPVLFLMTGIWLEDTAILWQSALDRRLIGLTFGLVGFVVLAVPLLYLLIFANPLVFIHLKGPSVASASFILEPIALATGIFAWRRLERIFRSGRRNETILTKPMVLAVLGLVNAAAFLPYVDFDRSYKPLAALVREELNAGARMALAGERERDLGALMFYLDSRLKVVALTNATEWQAHLYEQPGRAGIVVAKSDLPQAEHLLLGQPFKTIQPTNCGTKSRAFRLIMNAADTTLPLKAPASQNTSGIRPKEGTP
ncbi:MAG: glycosyltransferase family 39 protein [Lentisphaerae bacterium]|nr:glycosyltransferase family 39 protein [Lentisphaerota bacterium]